MKLLKKAANILWLVLEVETKATKWRLSKANPFHLCLRRDGGFDAPRLTQPSESNSSTAIVEYTPPELPNHRPIVAGNLALVPSETLPGGRPILVGTRQVSSFEHLPHHRPVFQSELNIVAMYGNRPVISLDSSLTPSASLPGNRPIAENSSSPSGKLMGYLD